MANRRTPTATASGRAAHTILSVLPHTTHQAVQLLRPNHHKQLPDRRSTGSGSSGDTVDSATSGLRFGSSSASSAYASGSGPGSGNGIAIPSTPPGHNTATSFEPDFVTKLAGRPYLKGKPYPYPIDFNDFQRQNLQTLLATMVVGRPLCGPVPPASLTSPGAPNTDPHSSRPLDILDVGCGTGYMSLLIHHYICSLGLPAPNITGIDLLPDDPFARKTIPGMRWRYVRHDLLVRQPLPFEGSSFDIILAKDMSGAVTASPLQDPPGISTTSAPTTTPTSTVSPSISNDFDVATTADQQLIVEIIRVLRSGGTAEFWDFDRSVRVLRSAGNGPPSSSTDSSRSPTFFEIEGMSASFAPTKNPYLNFINRWTMELLNSRQIEMAPSTGMVASLVQELELQNVSQRRFAVPLGRCPWERVPAAGHSGDSGNNEGTSTLLKPSQLAIRNAALQLIIQTINSLCPMLQLISKMPKDEWERWRMEMMVSLLQKGGVDNGECFEMGVWWATKR